MEVPLRDNLHSIEVTLNVRPDLRRHGAGTALVEHISARAEEDGRRALNAIVDVPLARTSSHASTRFATRLGFTPSLAGNVRHLAVPMDPRRRTELRQTVADAPDAERYRTFTFTTPWPEEYAEDQCELSRRMSTDEPAGDSGHEEEVWDARRIEDNDALDAAARVTRLAAVAQHLESGRLVAFSELLLSPDRPDEAWQMATLVHPEHRGRRLGMAVKLANLDYLAATAPNVRLVITGNAQVNAPMIAINDMLGFHVVAEEIFWQKSLRPS
jgi:GNAT superfamily N-acetyltransferase